MIYGAIDLETTGFYQSEGDRIVEIGWVVYDETRQVDSWIQRINPERNIPASATEVHGITFSMVSAAPAFDVVVDELLDRISKVDKVIIHNEDFDLPFLTGEVQRVRRTFRRPINTYCTMKNGRWATYDGKSPSVAELCFALGIEFDPSKAHSAEYDIQKTMECYFKGKDLGFYE